ncbi:MAG: radical SAM protein [Candidatus Omnitrophica bacterium]|nr:radical SAM protein [Candidatus Omnitrophota bacterium]
MNILSVFDLLRKNSLFWLSRKLNYPLVAPDMVQINFTFDCNLKCKMCGMSEQKGFLKQAGRQVEIDSATVHKIIRETKELGVGTVLFIGGEPFLHKDIFDFTEQAKRLQLATVIVTNGVLLDPARILNCLKHGVDWLSISIDAATDMTFSRIRGEKVFDKIISNIRSLHQIKRQEKRRFPKVVAVCTIMDENIEELLEIVRLCRDIECERILFQPVVARNVDQTERVEQYPGFVPSERLVLLNKGIDSLIEYKKQSPAQFNFIANSTRYLELIKKYFNGGPLSDSFPCYAGFNRVQVVQEGKLYFCVSQKNQDAAFGDIKRSTLSDLWYSSVAGDYRDMIRNCATPCLQWCSYREAFMEIEDFFQKKRLFGFFH